MTGPSARHEPTDPTARALGGVDAPVQPVLERRGGPRGRAGLIAVVAVAITVLAAGIGLFDGGTDEDRGRVASGPSGPASAASAPPGSSAPARPATALPGTTCLPAAPGDLPEFVLASSDSMGEPVRGARGQSDRVGRSPVTLGWPQPPPRLALALGSSASMVLVADARSCLRAVVAEYIGAGDRAGSPPPSVLLEIGDGPPRPQQNLGFLPDGDWIVRVVAEYATGLAGHDARAVMERFFRVFAGSGPVLPLVGPEIPCEPLPAGAPPPRLELVADDGDPVEGVDISIRTSPGGHEGAVVTAAFPGRLQLRVVGNVCATSWLVQFMDATTRDVLNENAEVNPGENPFLVAQNRMDLPNLILGHSIVEATVNFGRDISSWVGWDVTIIGSPPPTVEAVGPGGTPVTARPGCGAGWTLADGRNAWEPCGAYVVPEGTDLLRVRSGRTVRLEIAGWTIVSWSISCGERSSSGTEFLETMGCNLGGGEARTIGDGPARFLPLPGRHVVSAWITAERAGDVVGAQYFVEIEAVP